MEDLLLTCPKFRSREGKREREHCCVCVLEGKREESERERTDGEER